MWNPRKTLVLHNSRERLARLLNRRIRHLCTTNRRQKMQRLLSQLCYVYMVPGVLLKMILYAMWYDAMALAYKLFALSLLLKSLLFFCMYGHFAKCTNQDSNCVYAGTKLRHTRWYDTNMTWYVCNGSCRPLMCTSNVAGNTQMSSLDRQVTQNGLGVINAIARGIYKGVVEVTVNCSSFVSQGRMIVKCSKLMTNSWRWWVVVCSM